MNKTRVSAKGGSRPLTHVATVGERESFPNVDTPNDIGDSPPVRSILGSDAADWPEQEGENDAYLTSVYTEQSDDSLAPDVEMGINLLLHGISYR